MAARRTARIVDVYKTTGDTKMEASKLIAKFHEKFQADPVRFDVLPGLTEKWDAIKLVKLYNWYVQTPRLPQEELADSIGLDRSTVSRKVSAMNWGQFTRKLNELTSINDERYLSQEAEKRRIELLAQVAQRTRRKDIDRRALELEHLERLTKENNPLRAPQLKPFKAPKASKGGTPEHMVLMLSDLHVGQEFSSEETGGINEYNKDVFIRRAENLRSALVDILNRHTQLYDVPELHIFAMGDFVHGSNLGGEWGPAYNSMPVYDQALTAAGVISELIRDWSPHFKKVHVYGVVGNHGRAGKDKSSDKQYCNWDNIVYQNMKFSLSKCKNVSMHFDRSPWLVREIQGHKFACVHGDNVRGSVSGLISEYTRMGSVIKGEFEYLLMGHFHTSYQIETAKGKLLVNGSFVGGDTYSMNTLRTRSRPTQTVFGVHPTRGMTWNYCLDMDQPR